MSAQIIDGKAEAARWRSETAEAVANFIATAGRAPHLVTLLVGDNPASAVYVANKMKAAAEVGILADKRLLPATITQAELLAEIEQLNTDDRVDAILLQMPLPPALDPALAIEAIAPCKDVDGLTSTNQGRLQVGDARGLVPCTPLGCMRLIRTVMADLRGKQAVVLGRSRLVGRPMAELLLQADCTVSIAHRHSPHVFELAAKADILIAATGQAQMVKRDWVKPGAVVLDVGIVRLADGGLCGDVDFNQVSEIAGYISKVPGGVGPMTVAGLMHNTLKAAQLRSCV
jgi:methylenetetrahydrofolate dehydrogenase (NADP+)/methenyltetrahydrofolate cyclohydrolase